MCLSMQEQTSHLCISVWEHTSSVGAWYSPEQFANVTQCLWLSKHHDQVAAWLRFRKQMLINSIICIANNYLSLLPFPSSPNTACTHSEGPAAEPWPRHREGLWACLLGTMKEQRSSLETFAMQV